MMKKRDYLIVLILFIICMIFILIFFSNKKTDIRLLNRAKEMLKDIYTLESKDYDFKNGYIINDDVALLNKFYFDGNGNINIDKYGNIKMLIDTKEGCISKTSLGNIVLSKNKCNKYKVIESKIVKNNSNISFLLNEENLEYKISNKDDFKGTWIKQEYKDNLILNYFKEGNNYIWFKDSKGNISEAYKFNVDCLYTTKANYKSDVFYCTGSTIVLDNIEWIVIEDTNLKIKLMKRIPIEKKLSHCLDKESNEYCFYTNNKKNTHNWEKSYINYYLNNEYINKISDSIKNKLEDFYICDEYDNFKCDKESCGGRTKEEILVNNWSCKKYIKSKIKIISYDEYNLLYTKLKKNDKKMIDGNYWAINSYQIDKGSSIQYGFEFYILEDLTKKLDIRPIIEVTK